MDWDTVNGNWTQHKGKLEPQRSMLADAHLNTSTGQREQRLRSIQDACGVTRKEVQAQIRSAENRTLN